MYRPGIENVGPNTLTRTHCGYVQQNRLRDLHVALCHPGVMQMGHFVRTKNLPFSLTDIREMTSQCEECQQINPHFVRSNDARLIKATQVLERLNLDFKRPLPSASSNKYFPTVRAVGTTPRTPRPGGPQPCLGAPPQLQYFYYFTFLILKIIILVLFYFFNFEKRKL